MAQRQAHHSAATLDRHFVLDLDPLLGNPRAYHLAPMMAIHWVDRLAMMKDFQVGLK